MGNERKIIRSVKFERITIRIRAILPATSRQKNRAFASFKPVLDIARSNYRFPEGIPSIGEGSIAALKLVNVVGFGLNWVGTTKANIESQAGR